MTQLNCSLSCKATSTSSKSLMISAPRNTMSTSRHFLSSPRSSKRRKPLRRSLTWSTKEHLASVVRPFYTPAIMSFAVTRVISFLVGRSSALQSQDQSFASHKSCCLMRPQAPLMRKVNERFKKPCTMSWRTALPSSWLTDWLLLRSARVSPSSKMERSLRKELSGSWPRNQTASSPIWPLAWERRRRKKLREIQSCTSTEDGLTKGKHYYLAKYIISFISFTNI